MKASIGIVLAVCLVGTTLAAESEDPRLGSEAERKIVRQTQWLETYPFAAGRKKVAAEVLAWWAAAPDRSLEWCASLLAGGENRKARELATTQGPLGAGAFILENPDRAGDRLAYSVAGVESALRAYRTAVTRDARYRDAFYEGLVARWEAGGLESYVAETLDGCAGAGPPTRASSP